jgi:hypothetical protein
MKCEICGNPGTCNSKSWLQTRCKICKEGMPMNRITPEKIISLKSHEVFVFGSNLAGRHGKGAALTAMKQWGAKYGVPFGHYGQTFALPTVNALVNEKLCLAQIDFYVKNFIDYTRTHPALFFLVTAIGTGLAGYTAQEIAPLFEKAVTIDNISLPISFWEELRKQ